METIDLDKTIQTIIFEGTLEGMEDKTTERNTEIIGAMNIIETEIGQEKGHFQGIMVTIGIEVPLLVDQDQDLEPELIGIEYGVTIVGNTTILQEIVQTLGKKET